MARLLTAFVAFGFMLFVAKASIDPNAVLKCNKQSMIYSPFYQEGVDVSFLTNKIHNLDDDIKLSSMIGRECFNCNEVHQIINTERKNVLEIYSACTVDSDCNIIWPNTVLRGGCSSVVNNQGVSKLEKWVNKWNAMIEESNQKEFHDSVCGYMTPRCMVPPKASCENGLCKANLPTYFLNTSEQ